MAALLSFWPLSAGAAAGQPPVGRGGHVSADAARPYRVAQADPGDTDGGPVAAVEPREAAGEAPEPAPRHIEEVRAEWLAALPAALDQIASPALEDDSEAELYAWGTAALLAAGSGAGAPVHEAARAWRERIAPEETRFTSQSVPSVLQPLGWYAASIWDPFSVPTTLRSNIEQVLGAHQARFADRDYDEGDTDLFSAQGEQSLVALAQLFYRDFWGDAGGAAVGAFNQWGLRAVEDLVDVVPDSVQSPDELTTRAILIVALQKAYENEEIVTYQIDSERLLQQTESAWLPERQIFQPVAIVEPDAETVRANLWLWLAYLMLEKNVAKPVYATRAGDLRQGLARLATSQSYTEAWEPGLRAQYLFLVLFQDRLRTQDYAHLLFRRPTRVEGETGGPP